MDLSPTELREMVIRPTLISLDKYSQAAENLLMAIALVKQENAHRLDTSCAKNYGIFQIDVPSHQRVWDKYLAFNPELASKIRGLASQHEFLKHPHLELATNLSYATAIAWALHLAYPQAKKQGLTLITNTQAT
ncbi:MAG: hypothetical protein ACI9OH_002025 [Oleispira sp.]|jgi:hypothetical protein